MQSEIIVNSRPDREIKKVILIPGNYALVPYEDSRCKIALTDVMCSNETGSCDINCDSRIFGSSFDGNVLIGDNDSFIDRDFELILQQMCCGETCSAKIIYKNNNGDLMTEISCKIELKDVTEEQLISDWSWVRLFEASLYHKERGVALVKEKRITEAFRRFNKAFKMLVAIEPVDPEQIDGQQLKEMTNLRVKLYNNLAHCQLHYKAYDAVLELCNRALKYDANNIKALYRRCTAYQGLNMYEEAWRDIQLTLKLDPSDVATQQKANTLRPLVDKINKEYTNLIKKMFS